MKQHEIEIGKTYTAKVNDKMTIVRIDEISPYGGWTATNLATGKKIRIRSPQRLRAESNAPSKKAKARGKTDPHATSTAVNTEPTVAIAAIEATNTVSAEPKRSDKPLSMLDAAAKVLADAGTPLNAKAIIERMATTGLWHSPAGKTPEATLHAAISRTIAKKGDASLFRKAERGHFTVAG